jgi:hypothetical protein
MTDSRARRRELRFIQRQSVWLQKAVFALHKVDEADRKVREAAGESPDDGDSVTVEMEGGETDLEMLRTALEKRIEALRTRAKSVRDETPGL